MNNTTKKLLAMLLTVVMCFAPIASTMVFAADTTSDRIVTMEDFNDKAANDDSGVVAVSQNGGFWFDNSREGGSYTLENNTLRYICRKGNLIDIRFYHEDYLDTSNANNKTAVDNMADIVAKLNGQDFILSYRLKAFHQAINIKSTFTEHFVNSKNEADSLTTDNIGITDGTFATGVNKTFTDANGTSFKSQANINHEIYENQWYVIEYAFLYDETATSHTGATGAYTHVNLMINGELVETAPLEHNYNRIDAIRLGQGSVDECEIDDIIIATGRETLAEAGDFDPHTQQTHWIKAEDKTAASGYAYSFAVVGDTQKVSRLDALNIYNNPVNGEYDINKGNQMDKIYEWIANNVESKKIEYVLGLGDITEYGYGETLPEGNKYSDIEWENCTAAISQLNGVVPYSVVRGNHDGLTAINTYFNMDTYKSQFSANTEAAGFFADQGIANSYRAVKIGVTEYLFITLNYNPTDTVLEEAGKIIEQYPNHKVIITTHAYMYDDYTTISAEDYTSGYGNNDGEGIWNKLIRKYENITLVMSGHIGSDKVMVSQVTGDHGNTVTQMLIDFQVTDAHFGSTGNVVMLYFSADGNQIEVETYSPLHDLYFHEKNQFTFKLEANKIYANEFNSMDGIQTNGVGKNVFGLQNYGTDVVSDGVLKLTRTSSSDTYLSLRTYQGDTALQNITFNRDLRLSFKVKSEQDITLGSFFCRDQQTDKNTSSRFMEISNNQVWIDFNANGVFDKETDETYYASIVTSEWNEFNIVFHYDEADKQYDNYTIILNGVSLGTFDFAENTQFARLTRFEMFRYASTNIPFEVDDFYYGFTDNVGNLLNSTPYWGSDFDEWNGHQISHANRKQHEGIRLQNVWDTSEVTDGSITPKSYVSNGVINALWHGVTGSGNAYKQGFVDVMLNDVGKALTYGDMTFTMEIRPIGSINSEVMDIRGLRAATGTKAQSTGSLVKATYENGVNYLSVVGSNKKVALSNYRFSTVEMTLEYDYGARQYTGLSLYVNGEYVGSTTFTGLDSITYFRMFYSVTTWIKADNGLQIDSMHITTGSKISYKGETNKTEYIGHQASAEYSKEGVDHLYDIRLLAVMTDADISNYANVGFKVKLDYENGGSVTMPDQIGVCTEVYSAIDATAGITKTYTAAELGGSAIFALNCRQISTTNGKVTFTVTTYYTLAGQDTVEERTWVFTVDPAVNLPVQEA